MEEISYPRRWVIGVCVGWVMIHRWWWMDDEWMIDWNFGRATGQFLHLVGMSQGSLTIPGFTSSLQKVSSYIAFQLPEPRGGLRKATSDQTNLAIMHVLPENRSALSGFPSHIRCQPPAPIQKDLLRYLWLIYQSIYVFIHPYNYHNTYPISNNHGSEKNDPNPKETHLFFNPFYPLPWLWGEG